MYSTEYDSFYTKLVMPSAIKVTGGDDRPVRVYVLSVFLYNEQTSGHYKPGTRISGYEMTDDGVLTPITDGYINFYQLMDNNYSAKLLEIRGQLMFVAINTASIGTISINKNGSLTKISEHNLPINTEHLMLGDLIYGPDSKHLIASLMSVGKGLFPETLQCLVYSVDSSGKFQGDAPIRTYRIPINGTNLYTHIAMTPVTSNWIKTSRAIVTIEGKQHLGFDLSLVDARSGEEFQFAQEIEHLMMPWILDFNQKGNRLYLGGIEQSDAEDHPLAAFRVEGNSLLLINNSLSRSKLFHGHFVVTPDDCHILAVAGGKISDTDMLPDEPDYLILYGINDPELNCSVSVPPKPNLKLPITVGLSVGVAAVFAVTTLTAAVCYLLRKHNAHKGYTPIENLTQ